MYLAQRDDLSRPVPDAPRTHPAAGGACIRSTLARPIALRGARPRRCPDVGRHGDCRRPARVLTVDDAQPFRRIAHAVAEAADGFAAAAEVASGEKAVACAERLRPDVVLVDVRLPGIDGAKTSRRIAALLPEALIILMSCNAPPWRRDARRRAEHHCGRRHPARRGRQRTAGSRAPRTRPTRDTLHARSTPAPPTAVHRSPAPVALSSGSNSGSTLTAR
jgi:CheY-like chemotaxis protein